MQRFSSLLQRWCHEHFDAVKPIRTLQMFEDHMKWLVKDKAEGTRILETWRRARTWMARLARFHGYLGDNFEWSDSDMVKLDLIHDVHDTSLAMAADTDRETVRQDRHSLSRPQLQRLYTWALRQQASTCALLLAFCGIMAQTLARSGQLLAVNRIHVSIPEAQSQVPALFGPFQVMQIGDRGHHKVNKTADMAHWVMRTANPSPACPWFGIALKAALDARQRKGMQYQELKAKTTGT